MLRVFTCAAVVTSSLACAAPTPPPAEPLGEPLRVSAEVNLDSPRVVRESPTQLAGSLQIQRDFVVLIDRSGSSNRPSGLDVDGDGEVGRSTFAKSVSDPGDDVLAAEVSTARELLGLMDAEASRVAVIAFALRSEMLSPFAAPADAAAALAGWTPTRPNRRDCFLVNPRNGKRVRSVNGFDSRPLRVLCERGTSIGGALGAAATLFATRRGDEVRRLATIIVLSDGEAETPDEVTARRHARSAAEFLKQYGVVVHAVDFASPTVFKRVDAARIAAEVTGGEAFDANGPDARVKLASLVSSPLRHVVVRNLTTGEERIIPAAAGVFASEVEVAPGENRLALDFEMRGSLGFTREIAVRYDPPPP
ncbi:MAG: VWA domain-containing protein [Deltaproteobacteria bacterium]|nr:VWA domain-containing protein [Deltaproteobacteria bacterium]